MFQSQEFMIITWDQKWEECYPGMTSFKCKAKYILEVVRKMTQHGYVHRN